ncbi:MAG: HAD family hydrolase [Dehalococcoidia bacterium]
MTLRAVLFDLDDTLWTASAPIDWAEITRLQAAMLATQLARLGLTVDCSDFVRRLWQAYGEAFPDPDRLDGVFEERRWLDGATHVRLAIEAHGVRCAEADAARIWEALHEVSLRAFNVELYPDAAATVAALVSAGYRLGIVTSRPFTSAITRRELLDQGLPDVFEVIVAAGELGYRKPHELLFASALQQLGVDSAEVVMVGDLYEQDIVPAANLGMMAVLKLNDRRPDERHVLARHQVASLEALLALPMFGC